MGTHHKGFISPEVSAKVKINDPDWCFNTGLGLTTTNLLRRLDMATLPAYSGDSVPPSTALVPLSPWLGNSSQDFLQAQLTELRRIDHRLLRLSRTLRQPIDAGVAHRASIEVFSAVVLVCLWQDVTQVEATMVDLVRRHHNRLEQISIVRSRLQDKEVEHDSAILILAISPVLGYAGAGSIWGMNVSPACGSRTGTTRPGLKLSSIKVIKLSQLSKHK